MADCFTSNADYSVEHWDGNCVSDSDLVSDSISEHRDAFVDYWINDNKITMDMASQLFEILRKPGYNYLTQVSIIFLWLFSVLTQA